MSFKDIVIIIFGILFALILSWCISAVIYWLVTLCFGWQWSIMHSTGVWLLALLFGGGGLNINVKN